MNKILITGILAASTLFGAENLVTIMEHNSLYKIGKNRIYSDINNTGSNIYDAYKNKTFKNYSPYWLNQYEETYDTSPSIITMVGEKSIQYGSIYSKGFGKKFNINALGVLVIKKNYSLSLKVLETFNKNDLIYVRTKLNVYTKEFFKPFENYIDTQLDSDSRERYKNRLEYIYEILEYTNKLFDLEKSYVNTNVIRPTLFNYQTYLDNSITLTATSGKTSIGTNKSMKDKWASISTPSYSLSGSVISRYCVEPYKVRQNSSKNSDDFFSDRYIVDYRIKKIASIDIASPIPLSTMYMFKYGKCATTNNSYYYRKPRITQPAHLSASAQKQMILGEMKRLRNGGSYLSTMKSLYGAIGSDKTIKDNLTKFSQRGIAHGKIIQVNYGISESIAHGNLIGGLVKNITVATIFNNKVNLLMNEGFVYDIDNPPSYFIDRTNSLSAMSEEDPKGNKFSTLYYVVNQKLQHNVPEKDNFHMFSNLIPFGSKVAPMSSQYGGEILWLTDKDGKYIPSFNYNNDHEILIDSEDSLSASDLIVGMKNYSRAQIANIENAEDLYPINLKGIIFKYIPKNTKTNGLKYFGPRFDGKLFLDTHTQKIVKEESINCSLEECTPDQEAMNEPTKEVITYETKKYCGIEFDKPDTKTFQYFIFEEVMNRIIEEPFGDIQFHKYKAQEYESTEVFTSNQIVPKIFKYIGEVKDESDCLNKANIKLESSLNSNLKTNSILDFSYTSDVDKLDTLAVASYAVKSKKMTAIIDQFLMSKAVLTKNMELTPEIPLVSNDTYQKYTGDSIYKYYLQLKALNENSTSVDGDSGTVIIFNEDFSSLDISNPLFPKIMNISPINTSTN